MVEDPHEHAPPPATTMLERVAMAICTKNCEWHRIECTGCDLWESFEDSARAAIQAMRDPTDEMAMVHEDAPEAGWTPVRCWRAMIDAVLAEGDAHG